MRLEIVHSERSVLEDVIHNKLFSDINKSVAVGYSTYRDEEEGIELLTTDRIRRPLSEGPASVSGSTSRSDSADYSRLTATIRDQVFPEVRDQLDLESPDELTAIEPRLRFESNHPTHPDEVLHAVDPWIAEPGHVHVQISVIGADDDLHRRVYSVLADHVDELDGDELTEDETQSQGVVKRTFDAGDDPAEVTNERIGGVTLALATLIDHYHSRIVETFRGETAH